MSAKRKSIVLLITGILLLVVVWQVQDVCSSGALLRLDVIEMSTSDKRWRTLDQCRFCTPVANKEGDTLVLCHAEAADHIVAQWRQQSLGNIRDVEIGTDQFGAPQNTTVHDYTFKSTPPIRYFSTKQEATSGRTLYIRFVGTYTATIESHWQWHFHSSAVQFSTDGDKIAYAYEFNQERLGTLSIINESGRLLVRLDLEPPSPL